MLVLLCAFGICFILRGAFMVAGRVVPKGVLKQLTDREQLRGWCRGTGTVHILWGTCAVLLWCARTFPDFAVYTSVAFIACIAASIVISLRTTYKYSNK